MILIQRLFAMLLVALFALAVVLPQASAGTARAHDMTGMVMDHAPVPQDAAAKGVVDLCKAHCQAVVAVLPQTQPIVRSLCVAMPQAATPASALPSRDFPPEAPPPKGMILPV